MQSFPLPTFRLLSLAISSSLIGRQEPLQALESPVAPPSLCPHRPSSPNCYNRDTSLQRSRVPVSFLSGITVLEWGEAFTAPLCGKILADLGANVIKAEPPGGEPGRNIPPLKLRSPGAGRSLLFEHLNAGKKSVIIENSADLHDLATGADVLLEGHLDYKTDVAVTLANIRKSLPHLIITLVSAFGRVGPWSNAPGYPSMAFHMSGAGFVTPPQVKSLSLPPLSLPGRPAAVIGGYCAAAATVLSLLMRGVDGKGRLADIAEVEGMIPMLATPINQYSAEDVITARDERIHGMAPFDFYAVKDGWASIFLVQEAHWQRLVELMGSPEWASAEMFADRRVRAQYKEDLNNIMQPWLHDQGNEELYALAQSKDIPIGPARTIGQVLADPHFVERQVLTRSPHPHLGEMDHLRPPFRWRGQQWTPPSPAPEPGDDSELVPNTRRDHQRSAQSPEAPVLPLRGIRVIELGAAIASPFGAAVLADAGAEVIKIETQKRPDNLRGNWPMAGGEPGRERSYYYNQVNRHTLGLTLDLTTTAGKDTFLQLARVSDVVVENFSFGTMDRLGISYDLIRQANPSIIMLSLNGFGDSGPAKNNVAYGPLLEAVTGMASLGGYQDGPPVHSAFVYTDYVSGMVGVTLMLSALHRRNETGEGACFNVAQAEVALNTIPEALLEQAVNGTPPSKMEDRDDFVPIHGSFPCRNDSSEPDDSWIAIGIRTDAQWKGLGAAAGQPKWASDHRFATEAGRREHAEEIKAHMTQWTKSLDKQAAADLLRTHGVPAASVNHIRDAIQNPHLIQRGSFQRVRHPVIGEAWTYASPINIEGVRRNIRRGAPLWGEHNEYVCRDVLGLSQNAINDLNKSGGLA